MLRESRHGERRAASPLHGADLFRVPGSANVKAVSRRVWSLVAALALVAVLASSCSTDAERPALAGGTTPTVTEAPTTTIPVPPGGRQPTPEDKLRVILAGDSVMNGLAPAVATGLNEGGEGDAKFELAPSVSRDAASRVLWQSQLAEFRPDLVVMLIGTWERANPDFQPGDPGWAAAYQADVLDPFASMVADAGAKLLWIGMPAVPTESDNLQLAALNAQFEALANRSGDVDYLDAGDYLNGPDGRWVDALPAEDGSTQRVRRVDGLHLCPAGAERLAIPVLQAIQAQWNVAIGFNWQNGPWREPPTLDHPEECPPL